MTDWFDDGDPDDTVPDDVWNATSKPVDGAGHVFELVGIGGNRMASWRCKRCGVKVDIPASEAPELGLSVNGLEIMDCNLMAVKAVDDE